MFHRAEPIHVSDYWIAEKIRKTSVNVEVIFGAASKNCAGSGICRIEPISDWEKSVVASPCRCQRRLRGRLALHGPSSVRLYLPMDSICTRRFSTMFAGQVLVVREAFRIPLILQERWKLSRDYVLPGRYPLARSEQQLIIAFEIR